MTEATMTAAPEAPAESTAIPSTDVAEAPAEASEPEAPPDPKAERAKRLEAFAAAKRQELVARRAMQAERMRVAQMHAQASAPPPEELSWARALREKAKADPVGVLEELGATTEQLVKAAVLRGSPEEKIAQLEKRLAEREEAERRMQQQRQQLEAERTRTEAFKQFVATARGNEGRWEALSILPDNYLQTEGWKVAREAASKGYEYSDEEILDFLESREKERYTKVREKFSTSGQAGIPGQRDSAKTAPPKTLSHKQAQTVGAPPDLSGLSREQMMRVLVETYERAAGRGK